MILHGDCVEQMAAMPEASVDAIVCDPPYGLEFMGKEWDRLFDKRPAGGMQGGMGSLPGPTYIGGSRAQEWHQRWATEALRVAKPGAYLLAFGGTRTVHRLTCALEDAGWIIRDTLVWAYASGFPKSRALLKPAWEPIVMARKPGPLRELAIDACRIGTEDAGRGSLLGYPRGGNTLHAGRWPANVLLTDPLFDGGWLGVVGGGDTGLSAGGSRGRAGNGWGMGEQNVDPGYGDTGTYSRFFQLPGGDGCYLCGRASSAGESSSPSSQSDATAPSPAPTGPAGRPASTSPPMDSPSTSGTATISSSDDDATTPRTPRSRPRATWPGSEPPSSPAKSPDAASLETGTTTTTAGRWTCATCAALITSPGIWPNAEPEQPDRARFLIIPKADRAEREPVFGGLEEQAAPKNGSGLGRATSLEKRRADRGHDAVVRRNHHPTVKPLELMRHLVRLVTPVGGTVLDPFLGSGTTAIAAEMEGFAWVGIEREAEYVAIAEARLQGVQRGLGLDVPAPTPRNPGPTGHETGKPRNAYPHHTPKGWGGGPWATDPKKDVA